MKGRHNIKRKKGKRDNHKSVGNRKGQEQESF